MQFKQLGWFFGGDFVLDIGIELFDFIAQKANFHLVVEPAQLPSIQGWIVLADFLQIAVAIDELLQESWSLSWPVTNTGGKLLEQIRNILLIKILDLGD